MFFSANKSFPPGVGVWRPFLWCGCFFRFCFLVDILYMNLMVLLTRSWKGISFRYGGFFFVVIVFPATSLLPWVWVFGAPSCGAGVFEGFFG